MNRYARPAASSASDPEPTRPGPIFCDAQDRFFQRCEPEGDDFVARFVILKQSRLDVEGVKRHFGMATLKPFFTDKEVRKGGRQAF